MILVNTVVAERTGSAIFGNACTAQSTTQSAMQGTDEHHAFNQVRYGQRYNVASIMASISVPISKHEILHHGGGIRGYRPICLICWRCMINWRRVVCMGSRYDAGDDSDIMPEMTGH
jgi:hypothetical protein